MERRLSVIVVNYGSSDLLQQNLTRVAREIPDAVIVVVDNFTDDAERARVRAIAAEYGWAVVAPDANLGFGEGMNRGVAVAAEKGATDFLLLNPDAFIGADAARELLVASADGKAMVAPVIVSSSGKIWFDGSDLYFADGRVRASRRRSEHPGQRTMPWLTGACLLVPAPAWDLIGGFDDDYFLYWEDVDLSARAIAAGLDVRVVPTATAVHDAGGTQHEGGARAKSYVYYYYNVRNRLVFAAKHLDDGDYRRWRRTTVAAAWEVLSRGGRRQFIERPGVIRAAVRGAVHGSRMARRIRGERERISG